VIGLVAAATAVRSGKGNSPAPRDLIPDAARNEIKSVELEIDRIEAESLKRAQSATLDHFQQITLLGKLIFYDNQLSVKRNESCGFCHMPETGFSGPVSADDRGLPWFRSDALQRTKASIPCLREFLTGAPLQSGTR
jgi:cytochrome c peroxidase